MRQNSKSKTEQTPMVAPEVPPVVTIKRRKEPKPGAKEAPVSATEAPAIDAVRPIKTKAGAAKPTAAQSQLRPSTKKSQLIALLSTKTGTDVASISAALGWQTHTTRAALTMLRKAGYAIEATKPKGGGMGRYRIVAMPATTRGAA